MKKPITTMFAGAIIVSTLPTPSSAEVISACAHKRTGMLRITKKCKKAELPMTLNTIGPNGPQGPKGDPGPQGPQGPVTNGLGSYCINSAPTSIPVSPDVLPSYVPSGARQAAIWNQEMPTGWSSITPWGQAIGSGSVEIKSFEMWCDIDGIPRIISNDLADVGASLHIADPWYSGDVHTLIDPVKTEQGTLTLDVISGKITHWWLKSPRPYAKNVKNCYVKSEMKISHGVFASIGGDYWLNTTTDWQGQDVANKAIGMSDWYGPQNEWQTLIMGKCYTLPTRIY